MQKKEIESNEVNIRGARQNMWVSSFVELVGNSLKKTSIRMESFVFSLVLGAHHTLFHSQRTQNEGLWCVSVNTSLVSTLANQWRAGCGEVFFGGWG